MGRVVGAQDCIVNKCFTTVYFSAFQFPRHSLWLTSTPTIPITPIGPPCVFPFPNDWQRNEFLPREKRKSVPDHCHYHYFLKPNLELITSTDYASSEIRLDSFPSQPSWDETQSRNNHTFWNRIGGYGSYSKVGFAYFLGSLSRWVGWLWSWAILVIGPFTPRTHLIIWMSKIAQNAMMFSKIQWLLERSVSWQKEHSKWRSFCASSPSSFFIPWLHLIVMVKVGREVSSSVWNLSLAWFPAQSVKKCLVVVAQPFDVWCTLHSDINPQVMIWNDDVWWRWRWFRTPKKVAFLHLFRLWEITGKTHPLEEEAWEERSGNSNFGQFTLNCHLN